MTEFRRWFAEYQVKWRREHVITRGAGTYAGRSYQWILPTEAWEEGLWPALRNPGAESVAAYLDATGAEKHTGTNNLNSSWVACANLYFPFRRSPEGRALFAEFLRANVDDRVNSVESVELEYAEDGNLSPEQLLGELGGSRGKGQTSPDLAILVNGGEGIILTESKLTEHSFYRCSARTEEARPGRPANPAPVRCLDIGRILSDPDSSCHQVVWGRKYWEVLRRVVDADQVSRLTACPATYAAYQLFRQQALAEGYTTKYDLVVSAVAYDARNTALIESLRSTGIDSFPDGWARLFRGRASFGAWTHQAWMDWVRQHQKGEWSDWLAWIEARYAMGSPD